ncbi:MAG: hypothetical protein MUC90_08340, partial [Thermoplasmata archaeon]|nr:hypothetical protein [Thermoplasmata archaeon]
NMSLNFTTCYGSLDQKTYHHWHHCTTSFLPPGGTGDEPPDKDPGTNWSKTFSVTMRSRGTFWAGEFIDLNLTESRTYEYCVDSINSVSVPAGGFDCTEVRCSCGNDVLVEWRSEKLRHPAMMQMEYYDVKVYHSSEEWTMTLTSYDLSPSDLSAVLVGAAAAVCVAAIAVFMKKRLRNA